MDKSKRKSIVMLIGSLFVAIIFLTSYAAFSNNVSTKTSTATTIKSTRTFFVSGNSTAIIKSYSNIAFVRLVNQTNSTSRVESVLSKLQSNGTVSNFVYTNQTYEVFLLATDPYSFKQILINQTQLTNSLNVSSIAYVALPQNVTLFYNTVPVPITQTAKNYSILLSNLKGVNTSINITVSALVAPNGTVYNNQIRITSR